MAQSDLLGPLVDAIETAKTRIKDHGASLKADETRTRLALIDPVLGALGWDVSDPRMVTPEYNVRGHRPDYGLHKPVDDPNDKKSVGDLVAILEAKHLGETLANHHRQMTQDAENANLNYAGITDGDIWELYRFEGGGLRKEWTPQMRVQLTVVPTHQAALALLVLWRPNLASGKRLVEAAIPILSPRKPDNRNGGEPELLPPPPSNGIPLPAYRPNQHGKPRQIRFPNGDTVETPTWRAVLGETLAWLNRHSDLKDERFPLLSSRGTVLATLGESRPDNGQYTDPIRAGTTNVYFEGNANGPQLFRYATVVVGLSKENPSEFFLLPPS